MSLRTLSLCSYIVLVLRDLMDYMLFTFENKVPLMRWGGGFSGVASSLPLMNSLIKTGAAICLRTCEDCVLKYFFQIAC